MGNDEWFGIKSPAPRGYHWSRPVSYATEWAHLMSLPVNDPSRQSLRDAVPFSDKVLESRTCSLLSRSPVFQSNARPWEIVPSYESWLRSIGLTAREAKEKAKRGNAEARQQTAKGL